MLPTHLYIILCSEENNKYILNTPLNFPPDEVKHVQGTC